MLLFVPRSCVLCALISVCLCCVVQMYLAIVVLGEWTAAQSGAARCPAVAIMTAGRSATTTHALPLEHSTHSTRQPLLSARMIVALFFLFLSPQVVSTVSCFCPSFCL